MKKCLYGEEVLGLELSDFDLRTAVARPSVLS
jgi:hypothetical protein